VKKKQNRPRPNQKKAREKSTQRVTSATSEARWSKSYQATNALHSASLALAMAGLIRRF
jgi:hypothetical protein